MAEEKRASGTVIKVASYQEVEFLKQVVGPVLIPGLAEVCIHRPLDPIEYLAHWLIRYRFNEELKKADTVNALEVVKMKKWNKYEDILGFVSNGIVPAYPYGPIGYGGPIFGEINDEPEVTEEFGVQELFVGMNPPEASHAASATEFFGEGGEDDLHHGRHLHFNQLGPEDEILATTQDGRMYTPTHGRVSDGPKSGSWLTVSQTKQRRTTQESKGRNESIATKSHIPHQFRHNEEPVHHSDSELAFTPVVPAADKPLLEANPAQALDQLWDADTAVEADDEQQVTTDYTTEDTAGYSDTADEEEA